MQDARFSTFAFYMQQDINNITKEDIKAKIEIITKNIPRLQGCFQYEQ